MNMHAQNVIARDPDDEEGHSGCRARRIRKSLRE